MLGWYYNDLEEKLKMHLKEHFLLIEAISKINILFITKFGSHFYGTASKNSNLDYRGIYLPSLKSLILTKAPQHYSFTTNRDKYAKNTLQDCNIQFRSLYFFFDKLRQGEINAIDVLFAPTNKEYKCNIIHSRRANK